MSGAISAGRVGRGRVRTRPSKKYATACVYTMMKPAVEKNPAAVALGRLGGKAGRGSKKARTSEQARAAVMVRWAKAKEHAVQES